MKNRATFIVSVILLSVISVGLFVFYKKNLRQTDFDSIKKSVEIRLVPTPKIITSETLSENNILHELLINKLPTKVSIPNANLDIDQLCFKIPIKLENLSLNFTYSKEQNRVNFQGNSNQTKKLKIAGYYKTTSKNSIIYHINIHDKNKFFLIESTYIPPYIDNEKEHEEYIIGKFSFNTKDLITAITNYEFPFSLQSNFPIFAKGNFIKKDNYLNIENLYIKSNALEANANLEFKDKNTSLDIITNEINLDQISSHVSQKDLYKVLFLSLEKIVGTQLYGTLSCNKITYNGSDLHSFAIKFSQQEDLKKILKISSLKFNLPDNSTFNSSGRILYTDEHPFKYIGNISLHNATIQALANSLGLHIDSDVSHYVSLSSDIDFTPNKIKLENIRVIEGNTILKGNLLYSHYASPHKSLIGTLDVNNYNIAVPSFIQAILNTNLLLSKTQNPDYHHIFKQKKQENSWKDLTLRFTNLKTTTSKIKKLSTRYMEAPNYIKLDYLKGEDPQFNIDGNIHINLEEQSPTLNLKLEGNKVNMSIFNDVIFKSIIHFTTPTKPILHTLLNASKGNISIKLKNPDKTSHISEIDCSAELNAPNLHLKNCTINLFNGLSHIDGNVTLAEKFSYNIKFSHKNIDANKLMHFLLKENKKIRGAGEININGNIHSSNFNTFNEMLTNLNGAFDLKSERLMLTNTDFKTLITKYGKIKGNNTKKRHVETNFSNAVGDFTIEQGNIRSTNFSFITNENIYGKTTLDYGLPNKDLKGVLSLAYFDNIGKVDGFNITFYGNIHDLNTKLGTNIKTLN